jgi:hypothetical protein
MAAVLVPYTFLGFDTVIYLIAAAIGFMIAYNASRIYDISSKPAHKYMFYGFTILSVGFVVLALSSGYTYMNIWSQHYFTEMNLFQPAFDLYDFGYWIYYGASIVAYIMFIMMYLPEGSKSDKKLFFILPYWFVFFPFFHLISLALIIYVAFRSAMNYFEKKSRGSFFVMAAFSCFTMFHLLMMFSGFAKAVYVIAHAFLILGALSLLMVTRLKRR